MQSIPNNFDQQYQNHKVFKFLTKFIDFYEALSLAVIPWAEVGGPISSRGSLINPDADVYSSMGGTLSSIRLILEKGQIGDAFSLLRKYHDLVSFSLYVNLHPNKYSQLLESSFSPKRVEEIILGSDPLKKYLSGAKKIPGKAKEYRKVWPHIKECSELKEIIEVLDKDERYKAIRERCNDHSHFNFFYTLLVNDNTISLPRTQELAVFEANLKELFVMHVTCLFVINDHYLLDPLEADFSPEEILPTMPFIQKIFQDVIATERPDVIKYLEDKQQVLYSRIFSN